MGNTRRKRVKMFDACKAGHVTVEEFEALCELLHRQQKRGKR